jgi:hypothetical protein
MVASGQRAEPRIAAIGSTPLPREAHPPIPIADAEVPEPMSPFTSPAQTRATDGTNVRDHPVAVKRLTIRKRAIRDLGASHCPTSKNASRATKMQFQKARQAESLLSQSSTVQLAVHPGFRRP